jgi:hypothetical protein
MDFQFLINYFDYVFKKYGYADEVYLNPGMILGIANGLYFRYDHESVSFVNRNLIMNLLNNMGFKAWEKFDLMKKDIPGHLEAILKIAEPVLLELEGPREYVTLFPEDLAATDLEKISSRTRRWFDVAFPAKLFPTPKVLYWSIYQNTYLYKYPYRHNEGFPGLEQFITRFLESPRPSGWMAAFHAGTRAYRGPLAVFFKQSMELGVLNHSPKISGQWRIVSDLWEQFSGNFESPSLGAELLKAEEQFVTTVLAEGVKAG